MIYKSLQIIRYPLSRNKNKANKKQKVESVLPSSKCLNKR